MANFTFLHYSLDDLAANREIRKADFGMSPEAKSTLFPVRAFRYWWVWHALSRELALRPDATVVDMGPGHGQMRRYAAGSHLPEYPFESQHWIALDKNCLPDIKRAGYERVVDCDFNHRLPLESNSVDAVICIHVMEHVQQWEFSMTEITRILRPGGLFVGGSPTAPAPVSFFVHAWLRRKMRLGSTGPNGHVNYFSPKDWKAMVSRAGLALDFVSGSHFMRLSGWALENSKVWARWNLFWGGLVPSLGSEVYLQAHKP